MFLPGEVLTYYYHGDVLPGNVIDAINSGLSGIGMQPPVVRNNSTNDGAEYKDYSGNWHTLEPDSVLSTWDSLQVVSGVEWLMNRVARP